MNKHTHKQRTNTLERRAAGRQASFSSFAFALGNDAFFPPSPLQYTTIAGPTPEWWGGLMARDRYSNFGAQVFPRRRYGCFSLSHSLLTALCTKFTDSLHFLVFFSVFRFSLLRVFHWGVLKWVRLPLMLLFLLLIAVRSAHWNALHSLTRTVGWVFSVYSKITLPIFCCLVYMLFLFDVHTVL